MALSRDLCRKQTRLCRSMVVPEGTESRLPFQPRPSISRSRARRPVNETALQAVLYSCVDAFPHFRNLGTASVPSLRASSAMYRARWTTA